MPGNVTLKSQTFSIFGVEFSQESPLKETYSMRKFLPFVYSHCLKMLQHVLSYWKDEKVFPRYEKLFGGFHSHKRANHMPIHVMCLVVGKENGTLLLVFTRFAGFSKELPSETLSYLWELIKVR